MKIKTVATGTLIISLMMSALVGCGSAEVIASESGENSLENTESDAEALSETETTDFSVDSNTDEVEASGVATNNAGKLEDSQFMYNGNVVFVMDSFEAIDKALGGYDHEPGFGEAFYEYKKDNEEYCYINVGNDNGTIMPIQIGIMKDCITTSRNIKVGSSREDVIAAYGDSKGEHEKAYGRDGKELSDEEYNKAFGEDLIYDFGDFRITFNIKDGQVACIVYQNDINNDKMNCS